VSSDCSIKYALVLIKAFDLLLTWSAAVKKRGNNHAENTTAGDISKIQKITEMQRNGAKNIVIVRRFMLRSGDSC
jgi:hypothetical protein